MARKEKGYTFIGINFLENLIFRLLKDSFEVYKIKDFSKRHFQVAIAENTPAAAGFILMAAGIEAYSNMIFHMKKWGKLKRKSASKDISRFIEIDNNGFPIELIHDLITEVFIVRDVVFHGHVYEVTLIFDQDRNFKYQRHRPLKGYGDPKFRNYVDLRTKRTKNAKFDVRSVKIGFEDYFKAIIILDILIACIEELWGGRFYYYHPLYAENGKYYESISEIITHYYDILPNNKFKNNLRDILNKWKNAFNPLLSNDELFIKNLCPSCGEYGFEKTRGNCSCSKCGAKITVVNDV